MNLVPHVIASSAAGAGVWAATGEPVALPVAVAAGVLPDLDHLLDYYFRYIRHDWRRLYLLLHGWEYAAAMIAVYAFWLREPWVLAALLGYATQVGGDQLFNRPQWHTYFITARAINRFNFERVLGRQDHGGYMAVVAAVPFGKDRLRKWFEARLPGGGVGG